MVNWPIPKDVPDVPSFMGIKGCYERFIEGFLKITHAITYLQKKGVKFEATNKCEESFIRWNIYL